MYGLSAIHEFLRDAHVAYTVVPHRPAYTAQEEAAAVHVPGRDWGKAWANNFEGYRDTRGRGDTITGKWWDVKPPWGKGTMTIRLVDSWNIERTSATGSGFGGSHWTRPRGPRGCPDNVAIPAED